MAKMPKIERSAGCCLAFPYIAIVSAVVAGAGVGIWWVNINIAYDNTSEALDILGIVYEPIDQYQASTIGYLVFVCVDVALVLGVAAWRSFLICRRDKHTATPSSNEFFAWVSGIVTFIHYLLLVWSLINVAACAAAATVLVTVNFASTTASTELARLNTTSTNVLSNVDTFITNFDKAAASSPQAAAVLAPMQPTVDKLRPLANGTANGTAAAGCPMLCVDLAAFRYVNYTTRCICDPVVLSNAGAATYDAAVGSGFAIIGGFTLFIGLLGLIMNICGQVAGACSDRWHLKDRLNHDNNHPGYKPNQFASA